MNSTTLPMTKTNAATEAEASVNSTGRRPGTAWNWTALSQQAAAQNAVEGERRANEIRGHLRAAAAVLGPRRQTPTMMAKTTPPPSRAEPNVTTTIDEPPTATAPEDRERFSTLRIADRAVPAADLDTEMEGRRFIALRDMDRVSRDVLADEQVDWVTIGVVARKTISKPTTSGTSTFMVWGLSDLDATELGVFLFDAAYDRHWRELEGTIVAVLNAAVLPATEHKRFALKVTKPEEVVRLGRAVDFGICKGTTSGDARCRLPVNTAKSHYCLHHIASSFVAAGKRRQQLNNSFGTFHKSVFGSKGQVKNISAGVYGVRPVGPMAATGGGNRRALGAAVAAAAAARGGASGGWAPLITKKRRRQDEGHAVLGVPTVLSSTGAVVQRVTSSNSTRPLLGTTMTMVSSGTGRPSATPSLQPQRASRGHKIISSMLSAAPSGGSSSSGVSQSVAKKPKKVDMIKFMTSGGAQP